MAEDIERHAHLAYPEGPIEVLETLTKDQFTDALNDDETLLRVAQAGPTSLRAALGLALEIESFSLAARRVRPMTIVYESPTKPNPESFVDPLEGTWKKNKFLTELKKTTSEFRDAIKSVKLRGTNQNRSLSRGKRKYETLCSKGHLQQDCRIYNTRKKNTG